MKSMEKYVREGGHKCPNCGHGVFIDRVALCTAEERDNLKDRFEKACTEEWTLFLDYGEVVWLLDHVPLGVLREHVDEMEAECAPDKGKTAEDDGLGSMMVCSDCAADGTPFVPPVYAALMDLVQWHNDQETGRRGDVQARPILARARAILAEKGL